MPPSHGLSLCRGVPPLRGCRVQDFGVDIWFFRGFSYMLTERVDWEEAVPSARRVPGPEEFLGESQERTFLECISLWFVHIISFN